MDFNFENNYLPIFVTRTVEFMPVVESKKVAVISPLLNASTIASNSASW